jgi:RNA polymerase primary sigma factor
MSEPASAVSVGKSGVGVPVKKAARVAKAVPVEKVVPVEKAARVEKVVPVEKVVEVESAAGFAVGDEDEDGPAPQISTAGATADPVKDYLKLIGRVPLLNAIEEVTIAKRIEAGLFARHRLDSGVKIAPKLTKELGWIAAG